MDILKKYIGIHNKKRLNRGNVYDMIIASNDSGMCWLEIKFMNLKICLQFKSLSTIDL